MFDTLMKISIVSLPMKGTIISIPSLTRQIGKLNRSVDVMIALLITIIPYIK